MNVKSLIYTLCVFHFLLVAASNAQAHDIKRPFAYNWLGFYSIEGQQDHDKAFYLGDYERAAQLTLARAEQGDWVASHNLVLLYSFGFGVERDREKADFWYDQTLIQFRQAADQGDLKALSSLVFRGTFYNLFSKVDIQRWHELFCK